MRRGGAGTLVVAAVIAVATVVLAPALAFAHGALKRSQPAAGAHLGEAPRALRLTFTEMPELAFTRIQLLGPDSASVDLGPLAVDSTRTVSADIRGPLVAGTYVVVWQVAGRDGHPVRGRFRFTIAPGATGLATPPPRGEPAVAVTAPGHDPPPAAHHGAVSMPRGEGFGAESPVYVGIRWLTFVSLLIVIGTVAFRWVVLGVLRRRAPARAGTIIPSMSSRAASLGVSACLVLAAAAIARLMAQSYAMHGAGDTLDVTLVSAMLAKTVWGWGWIFQMAGVSVALAGLLIARLGRAAGWALAAAGALVLAFTPALSGHAASAPRLTGLAILADGVHVLSAGGWLGSLLVTIGVGVPAALALAEHERGRAVADLVNAFSPTALVFAGALVTTGLFAAWLHIGSVAAVWQSGYGRTLLVKLGVLSVVAGTGAYNWRRVRPSLGDVEGARRIRRSSTVELVAGVLVLIVTAVLVATPPPMDALTSAP